MKTILTVVGARPQFIKAVMVSRSLRNRTSMKEIMLHTGQHYDHNMSQIFFDEMDMPEIDHQLQVTSDRHGKQTAEMLEGIENVLIQVMPECVLIYGDTNSTLAAAVAAAKLHIPVAHIEAGLRSWNKKMPEEINRLVADRLSSMLFTPTRQASVNLQQEGYPDASIMEVGDVMYDAALFYGKLAESRSHILNDIIAKGNQYILATIHRAENTNNMDKLLAIFTALASINESIPVILPLHPRTRKFLHQKNPALLDSYKIHILEPVGFLDMIMLEKNAALIVTDSGGIQKEAFFYQVPCVTLRHETEWTETIELGWNRLVDKMEPDDICQKIRDALGTRGQSGIYPYGSGNAADKIVDYLSGRNH